MKLKRANRQPPMLLCVMAPKIDMTPTRAMYESEIGVGRWLHVHDVNVSERVMRSTAVR